MKKKIVIAILLLLLLVFVVADGEEVINELSRASLSWLGAAIAMAAVSYLMLSLSLRVAACGIKLRLPLVSVLGVSLASALMNHIAVGAGAGTFALRLILFQRFGVPMAESLTITTLGMTASNMALCLVSFTGLALIFLGGSVSGLQTTGAIAAIVLVLLAAYLPFFILLRPGLRRRLARGGARVVNAVRSRFWRGTNIELSADRFLEQLDSSLSRLRHPYRTMIPVFLLGLGDWVTSVICLGFCFLAVDVPIDPGVLVAGYAVGTLASLVAFLPGGLGVLEGSMAAVYSHFGVGLETAISAILLFRVAYYFIPSGFCFIFFHGAVHRLTQEAVEQSSAEYRSESARGRQGDPANEEPSETRRVGSS